MEPKFAEGEGGEDGEERCTEAEQGGSDEEVAEDVGGVAEAKTGSCAERE